MPAATPRTPSQCRQPHHRQHKMSMRRVPRTALLVHGATTFLTRTRFAIVAGRIAQIAHVAGQRGACVDGNLTVHQSGWPPIATTVACYDTAARNTSTACLIASRSLAAS